MAQVAAVLPGYATVRHSSAVLHLAPRSVRDLIYSGRLPSLRIGRLHYLRATDLEVERRRRLGLHPPKRLSKPRAARARTTEPSTRPRVERSHVDATLRRERAAERAAVVAQWAERHHASAPAVPFAATVADAPTACAVCARSLRAGARVLQPDDQTDLCLPCGRRALLDWADHRRQEAAAARRMAQTLASGPARTPPIHIASLAPSRVAEETAVPTSDSDHDTRETVAAMLESAVNGLAIAPLTIESDVDTSVSVPATLDSDHVARRTMTVTSRSAPPGKGELVPLPPRTDRGERTDAGTADLPVLAG